MKTRYILLPEGGIRSTPDVASLLRHTVALASINRPLELQGVPARPFKMLDTVQEHGPKLVELEPEIAEAINHSPVPLRAVPEIIHRHPARFPSVPAMASSSAAVAAVATTFVVRCVDAASGTPLAGLQVVAFDNFAARTGDSGTTDAVGEVLLRLPGAKIDRLYVLPNATHWGVFRTNVPIANPIVLPVAPLAPNHADAIRQVYPTRKYNPAAGVTVGVLDTGVGPHADLNLVGGVSTVTGSSPGSYADIDIHGTHVAGLIGGNGGTGAATLGLAPGVNLRGYRVFDFHNGQLGASNYAILKAMIFAALDGCDIINLSLGGGPYDPIVDEAITDARLQGMLVVVAAGNDGRQPVSYPAAYVGATAVSAMGRDNGFPANCFFAADIQRPPHGTASNPEDFLAAFSNIGPQIACTGLGSGVLSTLPGNQYGPLSGTSMAAPMVAGAAASLLSQDPVTYALPRDKQRSAVIEKLLQINCVLRFGGSRWEGYGLPNPAVV